MQLPIGPNTSAEGAACVHGYWMPKHARYMPLKGHALVHIWPVLYLNSSSCVILELMA